MHELLENKLTSGMAICSANFHQVSWRRVVLVDVLCMQRQIINLLSP